MSKEDVIFDLADDFTAFYRNYYKEEVLELANNYPGQKTLKVDWNDLFQYHQDSAEHYLDYPSVVNKYLVEDLQQYDLPIDISFDGVEVHVVGLNDPEVYKPIEITRDAPNGYIGVSGELAKVTTPSKELQEVVYKCHGVDCDHTVNFELYGEQVQDPPHECNACGAKGRMLIDEEKSTWEDYSKIRIQTPADETGDIQNEHIDGIVRGNLVWHGHESVGLVGRSGDSVTVYGKIEKVQKSGRGANERLFDERLVVEAIEFDKDNDNINIPKYKDEFVQLANSDDPIELWKEDLVPELYATDEWDTALELLVAYLFAAPRIDIPNGPTFRGDIHALIISDYGMGKSMVNSSVAMFSPDCIKESVTGMSSDVALLAAAVEDDFGEGQWTLQPGILVRANGGHVILDEIDKTDADLERMNNALEGEQVVDVNKAGQQATYKSRVGLLATGNPEESRFNKHDPISDQLDLDQSFLSRFDGIVTMQDDADKEQDGYVAEAQGLSYVEAQEYEYGDRDELDRLDRTITPEVGMNWIAHARQNVHPLLRKEHVKTIKEWYAEEVRQLNKKFADNVEEGSDMPVPVSARVVANTIRFSVAFARVHLREEVSHEDVVRAMALSKRLVGQNFDGEKFVPEEAKQSTEKADSQQDEYDAVVDVVDSLEGNEAAHIDTIKERATERGVTNIEHKIEKLKQKGRLYEPATDQLRSTE